MCNEERCKKLPGCQRWFEHLDGTDLGPSRLCCGSHDVFNGHPFSQKAQCQEWFHSCRAADFSLRWGEPLCVPVQRQCPKAPDPDEGKFKLCCGQQGPKGDGDLFPTWRPALQRTCEYHKRDRCHDDVAKCVAAQQQCPKAPDPDEGKFKLCCGQQGPKGDGDIFPTWRPALQ